MSFVRQYLTRYVREPCVKLNLEETKLDVNESEVRMLNKNSIRFIQQVVAPQRDDVLSLYLDINPAKIDNKNSATFIRTKDELKTLELPKKFIETVMERLENAYAFPHARSLVLFASRDETLLEHYTLPYALPFLSKRGVLAKYGQPYVIPLLQTLDAQRRYGIVFIDEARWRYFEIFFGQIEEVQDAFRPLDTHEWRELKEASRGVTVGVAARGGMGKDHFERRKEAWTHRFYKDVGKLLEHTLQHNDVATFFLVGLANHSQEFKRVLNKVALQKLAECVAPPAKPDASENDIYRLVQPCITRYEEGAEQRLLDQVQEEGIKGVEATLEALQAGRLQTVIAPYEYDQTVYVCSETLYVTSSLADLKRHCPNQHHELALLQEVLPDLVASHGPKLTYLHHNETKLVQTFAGLAGLKRW
jgi:peptide subunit release factor 1 (eRF1)